MRRRRSAILSSAPSLGFVYAKRRQPIIRVEVDTAARGRGEVPPSDRGFWSEAAAALEGLQKAIRMGGGALKGDGSSQVSTTNMGYRASPPHAAWYDFGLGV
jgi:hypothetical protein